MSVFVHHVVLNLLNSIDNKHFVKRKVVLFVKISIGIQLHQIKETTQQE